MNIAASLCLTLLLAGQAPAAQDKAPPAGGVRKAFETDEDKVAGHPDGDAPPLPKQVVWDLAKAPAKKNDRRQIISLAGWWRFSAASEEHSPTDRADMGWIELPGQAAPKDWKVVDKKFAFSPNSYAGKPLSAYPYYWVERDLMANINWIDHKIHLVVKGPWAAAELYSGYVPVEGVDRDGGKWFDITETLVYGGESPLAMRLKAPTDDEIERSPAPYIGLELTPTGPHVDRLSLARDVPAGDLEVTLDLKRPPYWLGLPIRLPELPLTANIELRDAAGKVLQETERRLGVMPKVERTVAVRVPMPAAGGTGKMSLHLRISSPLAKRHDEIFPVEFEVGKLPTVKLPPPDEAPSDKKD